MAIGRIAANKGYDLLIRAMRHVIIQRLPDTRLILAIGSHTPAADEVPLLDELKQLAQELRIADKWCFRTNGFPTRNCRIITAPPMYLPSAAATSRSA